MYQCTIDNEVYHCILYSSQHVESAVTYGSHGHCHGPGSDLGTMRGSGTYWTNTYYFVSTTGQAFF